MRVVSGGIGVPAFGSSRFHIAQIIMEIGILFYFFAFLAFFSPFSTIRDNGTSPRA
jgi:hypothetical protein